MGVYYFTMAKKDQKLGGVKRFGARYGKKLKQEYIAIEKQARATHPCPYCNYQKVKRLAVGIWECRKCLSKFTGKAYTPNRKAKVVTGAAAEQILEAVETPQEEVKEEAAETPEEEAA